MSDSASHHLQSKSFSQIHEPRWVKVTLISVALAFMFLFLILPLATVFAGALRNGFDAYWAEMHEPYAC